MVSPLPPVPLPESERRSSDEDIPHRPLRFSLQTGAVATRADVHAIISGCNGVVQQLERRQRGDTRVEWQIAFYPASLSAAVETMFRLLDLGQLSFSPRKGGAT